MSSGNTAPVASDLKGMKLAELQALASSRELEGISRMRKSRLVGLLSSPKAPTPRARRAAPLSKTDKPIEKLVKDSEESSEKTMAASAQASIEVTQTPRKSRRRVAVPEPIDPASVKPVINIELPTPLTVQAPPEKNEVPVTVLDSIEFPESEDTEERGRNRRDRNNRRRGHDRSRNGRNERNDRSSRRNCNRGERQDREEVVRENDQLAPITGILDIRDNHAFVRTSGYLPGPDDVFMILGNMRRWGLRTGDAVTGAVRQSREGEHQCQKYNALVRVDSVSGMAIEEAQARHELDKLTPVYPSGQLRMETSAKTFTLRVISLVTLVGKGQRGPIVSPPKAGKTMIIQQVAKAIELNNPEVYLVVVLVDERPEEIADTHPVVKGEVITSTFGRPTSDHTLVVELTVECAKRLVELDQDVVVLLDSLTRLLRTYDLAIPASRHILSDGVGTSMPYPPKKFFGVARNLKEDGSLTIITSALVGTGSKMDEVIFEGFKGIDNMEPHLSRQLADRRTFPAIDINASSTRHKEMLFTPEELRIMRKLRRVLGTLDQQSGLELILEKLKETQSNAEFLMLVQKTTPNMD